MYLFFYYLSCGLSSAWLPGEAFADPELEFLSFWSVCFLGDIRPFYKKKVGIRMNPLVKRQKKRRWRLPASPIAIRSYYTDLDARLAHASIQACCAYHSLCTSSQMDLCLFSSCASSDGSGGPVAPQQASDCSSRVGAVQTASWSCARF